MNEKQLRQTEQKVKDFISKHQMILPGDLIIAGVSGGADSMCLLLLLLKLRGVFAYEVLAVHV